METLASLSKSKATRNGTPKSKTKPSKPHKQEPEEADDSESHRGNPKRISKSDKEVNVVKKEKKKVDEEEEKKVTVKAKGGESQMKEKKVFDFPGQKHETPEERNPLRVFYETLYKQLPNSEMASLWMMEWGLLPIDEAKKVYEKKLKMAQQLNLSSPVKAVTVNKSNSSVSVEGKKIISASKTTSKVAKKRMANENSNEDSHDFTMSTKKKVKKQRSSD
ncbi:hypothetical protein QJS04_geneDACA017332 [Acorus gramineus]|uniref:Uncharacterized protein n=1 Tax=Acorus gramineus TaxID=55184 RepID=A0AAV9BB72_ACOGR|nr:hypothetical protein QJS04_geneDACA017332 [Acorus gramineus]